MRKMDECCENCKHCRRLQMWDYSNGGCEHKNMVGFACLSCAYEGIVIWMVGTGKDGVCEDYKPKGE